MKSSQEKKEADMDLITILRQGGISEKVINDNTDTLALTTPEQAYAFLFNNSSLSDPKAQKALGLDWSRYPTGGQRDVRSHVLFILAQSGALPPNFQAIEALQEARAFNVPLAALDGSALSTREATAATFVAAVEINAINKSVPRKLPNKSIDLRSMRLWPVRDQRPWPSCIGFAMAACAELQAARQLPGVTPPQRLSARFLYRLARKGVINSPKIQQPAYQGGGLKQIDAAAVLNVDGAAQEGLCRDYFEPGDEANNFPDWDNVAQPITAAAMADGKARKFSVAGLDFPDYQSRPPGLARRVYDWLEDGKPVAVSIAGFADPQKPSGNIWYDQFFWNSGLLPLPPPTHIVGKAGHAVCVVGYLRNVPGIASPVFPGYKSFPGFFLFRNSWGAQDFARQSPLAKEAKGDWDFPRGYGLIPAALMEYFVWEYGVIQ
jgi:hypothetical protein